MNNIIVTGSNSGLGESICEHLRKDKNTNVIKADKYEVDLTDYTSVHEFSLDVKKEVHGIVNCAGVNRIDYLEKFTEEDWDLVMDTNAKSIFNMSKHFLQKLKETRGFILNIVSNASHMPMTNSLAYNASKGAAHIMTLQLARELSKAYGITVFGISPNKLSGTGMSDYIDSRVPAVRGWSPEKAKEYQLNSLLAGEETDPDSLAEFIAFLLSTKQRHKYLTGTIIPYGA